MVGFSHHKDTKAQRHKERKDKAVRDLADQPVFCG
jgi:hypothetical protein